VTSFLYDGDGKRVRQAGPDETATMYIGAWYEESLSARQRYAPYGKVRYTWGKTPASFNFESPQLCPLTVAAEARHPPE
jgi:hypothetical protein